MRAEGCRCTRCMAASLILKRRNDQVCGVRGAGRELHALRAFVRCTAVCARRWWKSWRRRTESTNDRRSDCDGWRLAGMYGAFQSVLDPGDDALIFSPYWTPIGDLVTGRRRGRCWCRRSRRGAMEFAKRWSSFQRRRRGRSTTTPAESKRAGVHARGSGRGGGVCPRARPDCDCGRGYEDLVYDGEHVSMHRCRAWRSARSRASLFKDLCDDGMARGYAVAKEPFMTALRKIVLYSTNGVTTFVQQAMIHALKTPESRRSPRIAKSIGSGAICW